MMLDTFTCTFSLVLYETWCSEERIDCEIYYFHVWKETVKIVFCVHPSDSNQCEIIKDLLRHRAANSPRVTTVKEMGG